MGISVAKRDCHAGSQILEFRLRLSWSELTNCTFLATGKIGNKSVSGSKFFWRSWASKRLSHVPHCSQVVERKALKFLKFQAFQNLYDTPSSFDLSFSLKATLFSLVMHRCSRALLFCVCKMWLSLFAPECTRETPRRMPSGLPHWLVRHILAKNY